MARNPLPVIVENLVTDGRLRARCWAALTIAVPSGCSLSCSAAATSASRVVSSNLLRVHVGQGRFAGGDGAGLVEHDGVELVRGLQGFRLSG